MARLALKTVINIGKEQWLIRAPDHLGDAIMAEPAIASLCETFDCTIRGPHFCEELYAHLPTSDCNPSQVILFKPSIAEGLRSLRFRRRIGLNRSWLLTDSIASSNEHRIDNLNRIALSLGVTPSRQPFFPGQSQTPPLPTSFALFIVGTASPETVRWKYYSELAEKFDLEIVFAGGPGDETAVRTLGKHFHQLPTSLSLSSFASVARAAKWIIGSDCGLMHLACAARPHSTDHFVVIGSTDPKQTAPRNAHFVYREPPACWPCYRKSCKHEQQCLETPVAFVLDQITRCL